MGRRGGQRVAATSGMFAAIQKTEGNWVIVPLIHLITGQSSSLAHGAISTRSLPCSPRYVGPGPPQKAAWFPRIPSTTTQAGWYHPLPNPPLPPNWFTRLLAEGVGSKPIPASPQQDPQPQCTELTELLIHGAFPWGPALAPLVTHSTKHLPSSQQRSDTPALWKQTQ